MFRQGVRCVKELFKENGNPTVQFNVDKITVFEVIAKTAIEKSGTKSSGTKSRSRFVPSQTEYKKMLDHCTSPRSLSVILSYMRCRNRSKFRNKYITPMIDEGKLKMTIPDHPNSRFQQYLAISEKSNKTDNGYNK